MLVTLPAPCLLPSCFLNLHNSKNIHFQSSVVTDWLGQTMYLIIYKICSKVQEELKAGGIIFETKQNKTKCNMK